MKIDDLWLIIAMGLYTVFALVGIFYLVIGQYGTGAMYTTIAFVVFSLNYLIRTMMDGKEILYKEIRFKRQGSRML